MIRVKCWKNVLLSFTIRVVNIMKVNLSHGANSRGVNSKGCRTGTNHLMTMKGNVAEWSEHWTGNLVG